MRLSWRKAGAHKFFTLSTNENECIVHRESCTFVSSNLKIAEFKYSKSFTWVQFHSIHTRLICINLWYHALFTNSSFFIVPSDGFTRRILCEQRVKCWQCANTKHFNEKIGINMENDVERKKRSEVHITLRLNCSLNNRIKINSRNEGK